MRSPHRRRGRYPEAGGGEGPKVPKTLGPWAGEEEVAGLVVAARIPAALPGRISRRAFLRTSLSALGAAALGACTRPTAEESLIVPSSRGRRFFRNLACDLPRQQLQRIVNGYYPGRSGHVQFVPIEPNTVGNWFSHSGPCEYLQHVPLLYYGPGLVPAAGRVDRAVTLADIAPTVAELIEYRFHAQDGRPTPEVLTLAGAGNLPRLVVFMVWDCAGHNVLEEHPDAWPYLRGLITQGVWLERATLGSSPSISAPIHATIGTGAFPSRHGRVDHWFSFDGKMAYVEETGTRDLLLPAMAERYRRDRNQEPRIGVVAFDNWHLGMIGHGAYLEGGHPDVAVLRRSGGWGLAPVSARNFRFPEHVSEVAPPTLDEIDGMDGASDGRFFGYPLRPDLEPDASGGAPLDGRYSRPTAEDLTGLAERLVWSEWQTRVIQALVRREGFGRDAVPDLLFVNYKQVDQVSHAQTMNSAEMWAAVRATDIATERLVAMLNQEVGPGEWLLVVTADHGATPLPAFSGGFQIDERRLREDLERAFDPGADEPAVLSQLRPSQLWMDLDRLRSNGFALDQVAGALAAYTKGDNLPDPRRVDPAERDERVMAAAFPTGLLEDLRCSP